METYDGRMFGGKVKCIIEGCTNEFDSDITPDGWLDLCYKHDMGDVSVYMCPTHVAELIKVLPLRNGSKEIF